MKSKLKEVPEEGLEPTHCCQYWILSPARLPFRHSGLCELIRFSLGESTSAEATHPLWSDLPHHHTRAFDQDHTDLLAGLDEPRFRQHVDRTAIELGFSGRS